MGSQNPNLGPKNTFLGLPDCIDSRLLFFGGHFRNMQISQLNMQNFEWYLADLKSTGKNTIETVEKSLTDMIIRLVRIYPCLVYTVWGVLRRDVTTRTHECLQSQI